MKTENSKYDVIMYVDSHNDPTQSHYKMSEKMYKYALRIMIEHCIEDYGIEAAQSAIDYALWKNNLSRLDIHDNI